MSLLSDRYTTADAKLIASLGLSGEPNLLPLTVRRLCELIVELQARITALEGKPKAAPSLAKRILRRA